MADEVKREAHIVPGSRTFGDETVRVRGGKRQARAYWLKKRAEERLALLLVEGERGDRLARSFPAVRGRDRRSLVDRARFARLPAGTRLVILRGKREDLAKELADLMESGTPVKQRMLVPVINQQIRELDDDIRFLAEEAGEPAPRGEGK